MPRQPHLNLDPDTSAPCLPTATHDARTTTPPADAPHHRTLYSTPSSPRAASPPPPPPPRRPPSPSRPALPPPPNHPPPRAALRPSAPPPPRPTPPAMASLSPPTPNLAHCTPYTATDAILGPLLLFHHAPPSGRAEAHLLSSGGFASYPRLTVSASSPLYAAVNHLPAHLRTSELHRALAIAVLKYFSELPKSVKDAIHRRDAAAAVAFDEMHAGDLAARLREVEGDREGALAADVMAAMAERVGAAVEVDVVPGVDTDEALLERLGEHANLPRSGLRRAASKAAKPRPPREREEALGRELEELRTTEENYVAKLGELNALRKSGGLEALFPPCLERIEKVNARFLEEIRAGGLEDVARVCVRRFPEFRRPYGEYMRASAGFPEVLARWLKDRHSSFARRVQATGEQRLRSLTIEPVQRLPRYSLLIDNIVGLLEPGDASVALLNEARDTITAICSLQKSEKDERSATTRRLQAIVINWPVGLQPKGRLITAVDFNDIAPPYNEASSDAVSSILLLFPDCVAVLRRPKSTSMAARGVMAELDRPGGAVTTTGSGSKKDGLGHDLQFAGWTDIANVRTATSDRGAHLWLTITDTLKDAWEYRTAANNVRKMQLLNQYEGRAAKVEEEFVKARLERRCSTSAKGIAGLREARHSGLAIWSCIWDSPAAYAAEPHRSSTVIYLDGRSGRELMSDIGSGVDIAVSVEEAKGRLLRIECRSWADYSSTDTVAPSDLLPVLTKRIGSILRLHASPGHAPLTAILMTAHRKLLRALGAPFDGESRFSKLRPPSPSKLLSKLSAPGSPSKTKPVLLERSQSQILAPPPSLLMRGASALGLLDGDDDGDDARLRIRMDSSSPLRRLEETFEAFVHALRMTGSSGADLHPLHSLDSADPAAVETLLTALVTSPADARLESSTSLDVVFAAFRTFLTREWAQGMGRVIARSALETLRDTPGPVEFEAAFRLLLADWTPQNRRAFRTVVALLREMQEAVEREDWKGVLTRAFTGLLVGDDDGGAAVEVEEYMGLVDRLVEDMDLLFQEGSFSADSLAMKRSKSVTAAGSLSSSTSLRKRFGALTHSSSTSSSDLPQRPNSVWRTLSKREKGHVARSKSTDYDIRTAPKLLRPSSRDRAIPSALGVFAQTNSPQRPMSTIIASPAPITPVVTPGLRRVKRRSSLSDLTSHPDYVHIPAPPKLGSPAHLVEARYGHPPPPPARTGSPMDRLDRYGTPPPRAGSAMDRLDRYGTPPPRTGSPMDRLDRPASKDGLRERSPSPLKSEIPIPARSGTGTPRLKMMSTNKLRERLESEKRIINGVDPELSDELARISAELSAAISLTPVRTRPRAGTLAGGEKSLLDLSSRVKAVEAQLTTHAARADAAEAKLAAAEERVADAEHVARSLRKRVDAAENAARTAQQAARAAGEKLKERGRELEDARQENDILFETFNRELARVAKGRGAEEMARMVEEGRERERRVVGENA
ncbi:hypothetical protein EDC01DRAFT_354531 [Geopyxis carbonaria]|nr:hypothetical protein EDC01DRAFT_354531 [Geopyxis carbonaria]